MKRSDYLRWGLALSIVAFGVLSHDPKSSVRWLAFSVVLYGIPLAAQFVPRTWVRVYGIYVGVFVLLQAVLSTHFAADTYIVRSSHMNSIVDIRGDNLHGINGPQHMTTDARGFRTTKPVDYGDDRPYRIFFIGASTVAQDWVDDRSTFPHLVQESLSEALGRNVEVINTAVPGLRAVHHLTTMERVAELNPDMYVIVPGANDWGLQIVSHYDRDTPEQFAHATVHVTPNKYRINFLEPFRNYSLKHTLLGRALNPLFSIVKGIVSAPEGIGDNPENTVSDAKFYAEQRGSMFRPDRRTFMPDAVRPSYADTLRRIAAFCEASPAACVLVTHPQSFKPGVTKEYVERFWMTPPFEDYTLTFESMAHIASMYNRFTVDLGKETGLPVCDLEAQVEPNLENFYDEIHYNLEGSRKAAAVLYPCLRDAILSQTMAAKD